MPQAKDRLTTTIDAMSTAIHNDIPFISDHPTFFSQYKQFRMMLI